MAYFLLKRLFDITLAFFGFILFLPLFLLIMLLILLEDGRPAFYIKRCIGEDGKVFKQIKFRSMKNGSKEVTRLGRLLRRMALDELPQLINIIKGEMSFVGPRPYGVEKYGLDKELGLKIIRKEMLAAEHRKFFQRNKTKPGLTGPAQVFTPKGSENDLVLKWDLNYAVKRSFLFDLYIMFASIRISYFKKGWETTANKL